MVNSQALKASMPHNICIGLVTLSVGSGFPSLAAGARVEGHALIETKNARQKRANCWGILLYARQKRAYCWAIQHTAGTATLVHSKLQPNELASSQIKNAPASTVFLPSAIRANN